LNKNLAILDLGTNTFHILIVEVSNNGNDYNIIYKEKQFVKLGEFGLAYLEEIVLSRAIKVIKYYNKKLIEYKVNDAIIFGTAGLRIASNAKILIDKIEKITSYKVKIISGTNEAKLIFHGVKQSIPNSIKNYLVMDIGGGSVEFIIVNKSKILWAHSFNIGVSLLKNRFHKKEPIEKKDSNALHQFLQKQLIPLKEIFEKYKPSILIGASGSFDILADMSNISTKEGFVELSLNDFEIIKKDLVTKTYKERLNTKNLANQRADMIVVALLLIDFIIKNLKIKKMYKSDFALKEGIIWAYLNEPGYLESL